MNEFFSKNRLRGMGLLLLAGALFWLFYFRNSPGFYLLTFLASLFWRDPFMEMITGVSALDATLFGMRLGQIIYFLVTGIYFVATFLLIGFVLWRAQKDLGPPK